MDGHSFAEHGRVAIGLVSSRRRVFLWSLLRRAAPVIDGAAFGRVRGSALLAASPRALGKASASRFCGLPRRDIDYRLGELVGSLGRLG
jgi:hypothetical protein